MAKIGGRKRLLTVGGLVMAGVGATIGVVVIANPAGAHTATLSGVATCDKTSGTYSITYTGQSQRTDLIGQVSVTGSTPTGTSVSPMSASVAGHGTFTITQSGVPADAGTASLTVQVQWPDDVQADAPAQVTLPGDCAKPPAIEATAPTFADDSCAIGADATYTVPADEGVDYRVNGATKAAGTYAAADGSTVTVEAVATDGRELTGPAKWTHAFPAAPTHAECAGPATPSFVDSVCANDDATSASYEIPGDEGVVYRVDGVEVTAGTHQATSGTTITVTATALNNHPLNGTTTWTHAFAPAPTCDANGRATAPAFTDATCDSPAASYTIPASTESVTYRVNGTEVAAGKHTVRGGTTVTVTAVAAPGYTLIGTKSWRHTYSATAGVCAAAAAAAPIASGPDAPAAAPAAALANTGPGVVAGKATIVGLLLALLGTLCLVAGRRPSAPGRHSALRA